MKTIKNLRVSARTVVLTSVAVAGLVTALVRTALATPGEGAFPTLIAGPVALDELDIKGKTETHELKLKTKGISQSAIVRFHIVPGGHTGWHSHPGPAFVMVKAGTLTLYYADNPDFGVNYPAGTGWVEEPGRVHIARNHGDVEVELDAFLLVPLGAPLRIDEPDPQG
jgi:quercetin dioxygenase-like cupin family protein